MEIGMERRQMEAAQARADMVGMLKFSGAMLFCLLLMTQPQTCRRWAEDALMDWAVNVVPSLTPFLMALPWLTGPAARSVYASLLGWMMRPFGLQGETAGVAMVGLLAGSPASAAALRMSGLQMTRGQGLRLAALSAGAGPVFYLSFVARLAGSVQAARGMYMGQVASGVMTALLLRAVYRNETPMTAAQMESGQSLPISQAVGQILHIGGCMVLFAIVGQAVGRYLGGWGQIPAMALMEMTGGVRMLAGAEMAESWRLALMGGCCCLGGASILTQSLRHLRPAGISAGMYVCARAIHALLDVALLRMIL